MGVIATARALRKRMTPAEIRLWRVLRTLRDQGFRFRRQHPMRGYYLDFVCLDRRLIIEVDGASHEGRQDWDRRRDAAFAAQGFRTLRFENFEVNEDIAWVMRRVHEALDEAPPTRPLRGLPSPEGEG